MNETNLNNKINVAVGLSIVAVILCLLIFGLWIFDTIPNSIILPETFIGACVTLLSIIVTIAVGCQIFNIVEVKQMIKVLNYKQDEIETVQKTLLQDIQAQKEEISKETLRSEHANFIAFAQMYENRGCYDDACYYYLGALATSLEMEKPMNIDNILENFRECLMRTNNIIEIPDSETLIEIRNMDDSIRKSRNYPTVKNEYKALFSRFYDKCAKKPIIRYTNRT